MGELVSNRQLIVARLVAEQARLWRDIEMTCDVISTIKFGIAISDKPERRATQEKFLAREEKHLKAITERLRQIEAEVASAGTA